jgi:hypothetical protein
LQERVGRRPCLRLRRGRPVAEGEEADGFHGYGLWGCGRYSLFYLKNLRWNGRVSRRLTVIGEEDTVLTHTDTYSRH